MKKFILNEPKTDFLWIFTNQNGTVEKKITTIDDYHKYRAFYPVPSVTHWESLSDFDEINCSCNDSPDEEESASNRCKSCGLNF